MRCAAYGRMCIRHAIVVACDRGRGSARYHAAMELVLLSNVIWMVFLAGWCVLYFMQAKIDRSSGGRYSDYHEEP